MTRGVRVEAQAEVRVANPPLRLLPPRKARAVAEPSLPNREWSVHPQRLNLPLRPSRLDRHRPTPHENPRRGLRRPTTKIGVPARTVIAVNDPSTKVIAATPPVQIAMTGGVARAVAVAGVAARDKPVRDSAPPVRAPSQLGPLPLRGHPSRDVIGAAAHAAPPIAEASRIAAVPQIAASRPAVAMVVPLNNLSPNPSPKADAVAVSVAA